MRSALMRCPKCLKPSELDNLRLLDRSLKHEWIKTIDQLPAHGQRVLALVKNTKEPHTVTFFTDKWITSAGYCVKDTTGTYDLWQPVPTRSNA